MSFLNKERCLISFNENLRGLNLDGAGIRCHVDRNCVSLMDIIGIVSHVVGFEHKAVGSGCLTCCVDCHTGRST